MNGLWGLYTPFFGLTLVSEFIILIGLCCALAAALIAGRSLDKTAADKLLIAAPLGLVAGWLTAASFVGASSVLLGLGIEMTTELMVSILVLAAVFSGLIILRRPSLTYDFAIFWALTAVVFKNLNDGNQIIIFAAGMAMAFVFLVALFSFKSRFA